MDGEAWWAAVYGVAQSRIRLKQISSYQCLSNYIFLELKVNPLNFNKTHTHTKQGHKATVLLDVFY